MHSDSAHLIGALCGITLIELVVVIATIARNGSERGFFINFGC